MTSTGIALIVISLPKRLWLLQKSLEELTSEVWIARNCREAARLLESRPPIDVIITDPIHKDGTWRDVVQLLAESGVEANVVVTSAVADERLWAEVLRQGGFDVLAEPYDRERLKRVIQAAMKAKTGKKAAGSAPLDSLLSR